MFFGLLNLFFHKTAPNMKNVIPAKVAFFAASLLFSLSSCEKEVILPVSELPDEISSYISAHFPNNSVLQYLKDTEGVKRTYDLILSDGISLEFNRKREIISIDGTSQLPTSVIPEKIFQYVENNYFGSVITDWELDGKNQQIELNNGLDLEFDMNGDFLRLDN
jgi:hypothetical protein